MSNRSSRREGKREQFAPPSAGRLKYVIGGWIAAAAFVALVAYVLIANTSPNAGANAGSARDAGAPDSPAATGVTTSANEIRIPLAQLDDGRARFIDYTAGGRSFRLFAVRRPDGQYRAALDACEICYGSKLGYYQQGQEMVCRKCRQSFPVSYVGDASGGCHPVALPGSVQGDALVVDAARSAAIDREHEIAAAEAAKRRMPQRGQR